MLEIHHDELRGVCKLPAGCEQWKFVFCREIAESMVFALQIPLHPWVSPTEVYRFSPEEWANLLLYYDAVVSSLKPLRTDEGSVMFCAVCMRYITLSSPQSHSGDRHSCCVSCRATFLRMRLN